MKHLIFSVLSILILTNCASNKKYNLNVKKGDKKKVEVVQCTVQENSKIHFGDFISANVNTTNPIPEKEEAEKEEAQQEEAVETINDCDLITLKNGDEISAKVEEVGDDYIKYKRCDNLNGPTFNKSTDEVFMIKYSNGTKTIIEHKSKESTKESKEEDNKDNEEVDSDESPDVPGILSIIFGGIGIFVLPILFSTAAVVLGLISLGSKRKKKVLGWIGWGLGLVGLLGMLYIMTLYM